MLGFFLLALSLGIKHSIDADHLVAVSNLLSKSKSLKHTVKMSFSWAIGHMTTAVFVTILLITFKDSLLSFIFDKLELLVALMLVGLGIISVYQARFLHIHKHKHRNKLHIHWHMHLKDDERVHSHKHMFGIGIVHGLASNNEFLLLLTVSMGLTSLSGIIVGIAVFSLGVVIGMVVFSIFLTYPILKIESEKLIKIVNGTVGFVSIVYGLILLFSL